MLPASSILRCFKIFFFKEDWRSRTFLIFGLISIESTEPLIAHSSIEATYSSSGAKLSLHFLQAGAIGRSVGYGVSNRILEGE